MAPTWETATVVLGPGLAASPFRHVALHRALARHAQQEGPPTTAASPLSPRYCIWSSIADKDAFTLRAFFISSAETNGYSAYSRKLGR
jgi:hypothetical protein